MLSREQSHRVDEILEDLADLLRELDELMDPPLPRRPHREARRRAKPGSGSPPGAAAWDDFLLAHPELTAPAKWPTDDEIVRALRWAIKAGDRKYRRLGWSDMRGATWTSSVARALWGGGYKTDPFGEGTSRGGAPSAYKRGASGTRPVARAVP